MTVVLMSDRGRLTLPIETRRALGIEGEAQLQVEVTSDSVVLRPVVVLPRGDAWAYTIEHRALLERAHQDSREGRVRELTEDDLVQIAQEAERHQAGQGDTPTDPVL